MIPPPLDFLETPRLLQRPTPALAPLEILHVAFPRFRRCVICAREAVVKGFTGEEGAVVWSEDGGCDFEGCAES